MTYRIYALTEDQLDSLLRFLEWEPNAHAGDQERQPECPLPILGNDNNLTRIDPDVAIPMHNVFRDRWEREVVWNGYQEYCHRRRPCVKHALDFPEVRQRFERSRREDQGRRFTLGDYVKRQRDGKGSGPQSST